MLKYLLLVCACLLATVCRADDFPAIPSASTDSTGFVPEGWEIFDRCETDIDGDGHADLVLALQKTGFQEHTHCLKILVIAFYDPLLSLYRTVALSNEFLNPPADNSLQYNYFTSVTAPADGTLRFDFEFVNSYSAVYTGYSAYIFRYRRGCFELIRQEIRPHRFMPRRDDPVNVIDYLTGEYTYTSRNEPEQTVTFQPDDLPTLSSVGRAAIWPAVRFEADEKSRVRR